MKVFYLDNVATRKPMELVLVVKPDRLMVIAAQVMIFDGFYGENIVEEIHKLPSYLQENSDITYM